MGLSSMTGFADVPGSAEGLSWSWEARSVNGRGLDLRLRLPEGFEPLDASVRAVFGKVFARGSITVGLRLARGGAAAALPRLSRPGLEAALETAAAASGLAASRGMALAPPTVGELLSLRGVIEADTGLPSENETVLRAVTGGIEPLAAALAEARAAEGAGLAALIAARVDEIERLGHAARGSAEARAARTGELLRSRVRALLDASDIADEARLAQELALIAVRADVSEELDRLDAHVAAARELLAGHGPVGRKLDFLTQEFNREANTLCSKSGDSKLTAIGLQIKVAIDQMREQVQNVE